jgi:hypothetical protein
MCWYIFSQPTLALVFVLMKTQERSNTDDDLVMSKRVCVII